MEPRNYEAGAAATPPTAPVTPSHGYPTEGDPQTATPATKPGAFSFYKIGESLRNVITFAGLTPSDGDLTLFQQAIVKIVSMTNHSVKDGDPTFNASVADKDAVYWDDANSRYDKAIADGTDKQKVVGFANVTNNNVVLFGQAGGFAGLTAGSRYYLSDATAGAITTAAPAEKVTIGIAKKTTILFVDIDPETAVVQATEAIPGIAKVATQSKVDAGVDDEDYLTSLKLRKTLAPVGEYDVILPNGSYTSGTFTIPGGRTWDDYDLVIMSGANNTDSTRYGHAVIIIKESMAASLNSWSLRAVSSGGAEAAQIDAISATQFTVTKDGSDRVRYLIGYRKPGVA